MDSKVCNKCNERLFLEDFYLKRGSKDGRESTCIECKKLKSKTNRKKNREHYLAYDKERNSTLKRLDERREYQKSERGKKIASSYRQKVSGTIKSEAQKLAKMAIERGDIKKPLQCEDCKKFTYALQAHHKDYTKPYDVNFLCIDCHNIADKIRRQQESDR